MNGRRFAYLTTIGSGYGEYVLGKDVNVHWGSIGEDQWGADLTWEKEREINIGIETRFLNGFYLQADYFKRHRTGIFQQRKSMPSIVGVQNTPWGNIGEFDNQGVDATLEYTHKFGDFLVSFRSNYTFARNNLTENDEPDYIYTYQNRKGNRLNQPFGLIAEGLFTSEEEIASSPEQTFGTVRVGDIKYKDVNGDGIVNDADMVAIGATTKPNLIYGFGVSAQWNGFDFNVHFQGSGKSSFFINGTSVHAFSDSQWGNVFTNLVKDRWVDPETAKILGIPVNENPNASYPRLTYGGNENNYKKSTFWLRDGSYLRLKTLEVGYTLPKSIVNKMRFNKIRIFFIGTNLLTFAKFKEWDPEMGSSNGEQYPLAKVFTLGLTVNI